MIETVKKVFKMLAPPVITQGLIKMKRKTETPEWEYVPEGWSKKNTMRGWNMPSVLQAYKAKWPEFLESISGTGPIGASKKIGMPKESDYGFHNTIISFAYVLALAARKKDSISMLDWGGGIGSYYAIGKAMLPDLKINYHCKDLPLLCEYGRRQFPDAAFYDDEDICFKRSYDLVLASGSLQYAEDWKTIIARLASVSQELLYITRLPMVRKADSFVVVQRPWRSGYDTEYLTWFLNRDELLGYMNNSKMELLREFILNERVSIMSAPEQAEFRGLLFRPVI